MDKTIFKNTDLKKSQQSKAKESRKKINKASFKKRMTGLQQNYFLRKRTRLNSPKCP